VFMVPVFLFSFFLSMVLIIPFRCCCCCCCCCCFCFCFCCCSMGKMLLDHLASQPGQGSWLSSFFSSRRLVELLTDAVPSSSLSI